MLAVFALSSSAVAEEIAVFDLTDNLNATSVASNIQSAELDHGNLVNFIIYNDGFGKVLTVYPASGSTSVATALANGTYFTLTISAAEGYVLDLSQLAFEVGKGGDSDPRGYFIRSSVDDFATDIAVEQLPTGAQATPAATTISLSGIRNIHSITFRVYVYGPWFGNSVDFRNLTLSGVVQDASGNNSGGSAVPALPVWGMALLALLLCFVGIRILRRQGSV